MVHADLQNKDYVAWRQFLKDSDRWTHDQIADYQLREPKRITRHAYENTAGYHALYQEAGVHPSDIRSFEDFRRLPCVDKEMIRDRLEEFSAPVEGRTHITTGA